jgi:hypothetical protein
MTSLDVVKCNIQVDPQKYQGLLGGVHTVLTQEGAAGLLKGWAPTAMDYSLQGAAKFGLYEYFLCDCLPSGRFPRESYGQYHGPTMGKAEHKGESMG